jgi:hypothetical protein
MKHLSLSALALAGLVFFSSCKKDDDNGGGSGSASVSTLGCGSASFSATASPNQSYTGTATVQYVGGNGASYAAGSAISSTGVTGLTATLKAGTLANGTGSIVFDIIGTPSGNGTAAFAISFGGQSCSINLPVGSGGSIVAKWQWINYVDSLFFIASNYGRTTSAYSPIAGTASYSAGIFYDLKANGSFDLLVTSDPTQNDNGTYTYSGGILGLLYTGETNPLNYPVMALTSTALRLRIGVANNILDTVDVIDTTISTPYDGTYDSVDTYNLTRTRNLVKS